MSIQRTACALFAIALSLGSPQAVASDYELKRSLAGRLHQFAADLEARADEMVRRFETLTAAKDANALAGALEPDVLFFTTSGEHERYVTPLADADLIHIMIDQSLRRTVKNGRPCPEKTCSPISVLSPVEGQPYALCIANEVRSAAAEHAAEARDLAVNLPGMDTETIKDEVGAVFGSLSTGFTTKCSSIGMPASPMFAPTIQQNVAWGPACEVGTKTLPDGSAPLYHPQVASLMFEGRRNRKTSFCTGTLIAQNAVLTAAHCLCDTRPRSDDAGEFFPHAAACRRGVYAHNGQWIASLDPSGVSVFLQHAGEADIEEIVVHPDYQMTDALPRADLAILFLRTPVVDIPPAALWQTRLLSDAPRGVGAGFGFANPLDAAGRPSSLRTSPLTGLKLSTNLQTAPCSRFEQARRLICSDYVSRRTSQALGGPCHGDSGAPLFLSDGEGSSAVAGVITAGSSCDPGARAYSMEVFPFRAWIADALRRRPPSTANANKTPRQELCRLCKNCAVNERPGGPVDLANRATLKIRKGVRTLRVAANCTPSLSPWRLHVSLGSEEARCPAAARSAVAVCQTAVKQNQQWSIHIEGAPIQDCQIVATTFE